MTRVIAGLQYAHKAKKPESFGVSRPRGAKAYGVRYEKALAKALPVAKHGQWFEFIDGNGHGFCQTDLLLEFPTCVAILEAKYTWTPQGHQQLERLYFPVVARALGKPVFGVQVCKNLTDGMGEVLVASRLGLALEWAVRGKRVALHWMGGQEFLKLVPGTRFGDPTRGYAPILVPALRAS